MKTCIYCKTPAQGVHSFFLLTEEAEYFLFSQGYRKGVHSYFSKGVFLDDARDYSRSNHGSAVLN